MRGHILDTVGIEFEGIGLTNRQALIAISNSHLESYLLSDRDASVEFYSGLIRGSNIRTNIHAPSIRDAVSSEDRATMGYEIKTIDGGVPIPQAEKIIWRFLSELRKLGDFTNNRAALHFHVGFSYSIKILIILMKLGLKLDPLFFRMAGMGSRYRGETNHSTYCRPLVLGPVVSGNRSKFRLLNPQSACKVETVDQFWYHYAINPRADGGVHRYHPGRYFGLNLYSIPLHGTLEFRYFNQSFDPLLVTSMIKLVRGISELVFYINEDFIESITKLNIFEEYPDSMYEDVLIKLLEAMRTNHIEYIPTNKEIESLFLNIKNTPHHKIEQEDVATHIRDYSLSSFYIDTGYFEKIHGKVKPSGQIDIHTIGEFSILD